VVTYRYTSMYEYRHANQNKKLMLIYKRHDENKERRWHRRLFLYYGHRFRFPLTHAVDASVALTTGGLFYRTSKILVLGELPRKLLFRATGS
jgi:hypothetical protein